MIWFSATPDRGHLELTDAHGKHLDSFCSEPKLAPALAYAPSEGEGPTPFQHRVRITGLTPGGVYQYRVSQGQASYEDQFRTPAQNKAVRFMAFADCETEPESRGKRAKWQEPGGKIRRYLVDQSQGLNANLGVIRGREPDFLVIAGDLVESGGEQRDWDEFFRHFTSEEPQESLAGSVPLVAAPGNHEYYGGPKDGRYTQPFSERAINKMLTYFPEHGRYYCLDYGPVSVVVLDSTNGLVDDSPGDTNWHLAAETSASPGVDLDSPQIQWLERELARAQRDSAFTFVAFHHCPYSSGPHGYPAGLKSGEDPQSGRPMRLLMPLFKKYGVSALLCGHDEMFERSEVEGVHIYDVGVAGDGLRGPEPDLDNPQQRFLAHRDSPEVWRDGVLVDGGKHYGHLEVEVWKSKSGWRARLYPIYVFPVADKAGRIKSFERRVYSDVVELRSKRSKF